MSEIQRYYIDWLRQEEVPEDDGEYVIFTDHEAVLAAAQREIERLKGIQVGCEGTHRHNGPAGHAHGHNTAWVECNPNKPHHHHDEKCLLAYQRKIRELTDRAEKAEAERDEAVKALKMAYRKHVLADDSIGYGELDDILLNSLCNIMGDDGYQKWLQSLADKEVKDNEMT